MSVKTNSNRPLALELAAEDMRQVDSKIAESLKSEVPLVGQVAQYIIKSGGKRLRPILLLLMSRAISSENPHRFSLAAVIEFIHTATLLHDDVVDESTLRRGNPTANEIFGNPASVLVGDFLYSRAFQMMVSTGKMRVMEILADATNIIAEGEVLQLMNTHNPNLTQEEYLKVIRSKTAKLFEASTRLAAVIADSTPEIEKACAEYGQSIGTAFQVIDDVLDYTGSQETLGKNLGDDLREGKTTLPLIFAMQKCPAEQAQIIKKAIEGSQEENLEQIIQIIKTSGALEQTKKIASQQAQLAINAIAPLPENQYKKALIELASSLLERQE